MRVLLALVMMCAISLSAGCERRQSLEVIKRFPNDLQYEKMVDVDSGPRVLAFTMGNLSGGGVIVIPGDVTSCESNAFLIFGKKVPAKRPATWMSPMWEAEAFFVIDPSRINTNGLSDDEILGSAVTWYTNSSEFKDAIRAPGGKK